MPAKKHADQTAVTLWLPNDLATQVDVHLADRINGIDGATISRQKWILALIRRALEQANRPAAKPTTDWLRDLWELTGKLSPTVTEWQREMRLVLEAMEVGRSEVTYPTDKDGCTPEPQSVRSALEDLYAELPLPPKVRRPPPKKPKADPTAETTAAPAP